MKELSDISITYFELRFAILSGTNTVGIALLNDLFESILRLRNVTHLSVSVSVVEECYLVGLYNGVDVTKSPRVSIIRILQCLLNGILMTRLCFSLKDPHIPSPRLCLLYEKWAGLSDRKDHETWETWCYLRSEIKHV